MLFSPADGSAGRFYLDEPHPTQHPATGAAWIGGGYCPVEQATISVLDLGVTRSDATYDVGLKDEFDYVKFNPPALRGVSQRDALFHDNRASFLDEVFSKFKHQIDGELSAPDLADLVAFLQSL